MLLQSSLRLSITSEIHADSIIKVVTLKRIPISTHCHRALNVFYSRGSQNIIMSRRERKDLITMNKRQ